MTTAFDWIFPRRCPVCDGIVTGGALIHGECLEKLRPLCGPVCMICGRELVSPREEFCERCKNTARPFDKGRALLLYDQNAMNSMAAVKYKNKREYLDFYASSMARRFRGFVEEEKPDVLIPVPIHPARRRIRGFNQAEELARRLSDIWGIPVNEDLLIRIKNTDPLKGMGASERKGHLKNAFALSEACSDEDVPGRVLIIDDIYTTGSTIEACAKTLRAGGVARVTFLVICMGYAR